MSQTDRSTADNPLPGFAVEFLLEDDRNRRPRGVQLYAWSFGFGGREIEDMMASPLKVAVRSGVFQTYPDATVSYWAFFRLHKGLKRLQGGNPEPCRFDDLDGIIRLNFELHESGDILIRGETPVEDFPWDPPPGYGPPRHRTRMKYWTRFEFGMDLQRLAVSIQQLEAVLEHFEAMYHGRAKPPLPQDRVPWFKDLLDPEER